MLADFRSRISYLVHDCCYAEEHQAGMKLELFSTGEEDPQEFSSHVTPSSVAAAFLVIVDRQYVQYAVLGGSWGI